MNVLMVSPGFPAEMPFFTRALRQVGASVIGIGDQPDSALPPIARDSLSAYFKTQSFSDEGAFAGDVLEIAKRIRLDRIECLWEPLLITVARLREKLGLPGMTVDGTVPFRDKEIMKQKLDRAGIRTPRHASSTTVTGCHEAAERIGFPLVIKPVAGAGGQDTYRVDSAEGLGHVIERVRHVPEVSLEEFIEGEDFTFDTLCIDGEIKHFNISFYRPRALDLRTHEWISPQTYSIRHVDSAEVQPGIRMGIEVLRALGFRTGVTHMEWFRTPDGGAVFGEIAARAPGSHTVDLMNYACDIDMYRGWAEAICYGRFTQHIERKYNSGWVFKRAQGQGHIQRIEGLTRLMAELGPYICHVDLLSIGAPRRNWKQVLIGDGMLIFRHPDLERAMEIGDRIAVELQLFAG
jgi:biotin carboxylase